MASGSFGKFCVVTQVGESVASGSFGKFSVVTHVGESVA